MAINNSIVKVILLIFLAQLNAYASEPSYCSLKESFYQKEKFSIEEGISRLDLTEVSIVYFAEPHLNFSIELYPQLVGTFANNGFQADCYLLENHQSPELVRELAELNLLPRNSELPSLKELLFSGQYDLVMEMHKQGMKIFAVDNHDYYSLPSLDDRMNARDEHMAQEISNLKESGQCSRIIFPTGSLHVSSRFNLNRKNMRDILNDQAFKSISLKIDLQGLKENIPGVVGRDLKPLEPNVSYSWLPANRVINVNTVQQANISDFVCSNNPKITKTPYVIFPDQNDLFGFDNAHNPEGSFSDFDLSVTFSCTGDQCRNYNDLIQEALIRLGLRLY